MRALLLLMLPALQPTQLGMPRDEPGPKMCLCPEAVQRHVWCEVHNVGLLAGVKITSPLLFEVLDAHGHQADPNFIPCAACRKHYDTGGFCPDCRIGYVNHLAYMSPLTYHLALGKHTDPAILDCAACRANASSYGWCDRCRRGMAGNVAYTDNAEFNIAIVEFKRLLVAIEKMPTCDGCSVAIMCDGQCWYCKKQYRDTRDVPKEATPDSDR
ncbi:MAG: hypothetical protein HOP29_12150 [Phycisphaerales bacterium]|nr:hypothetical protein [Phycisphaerales bacterium]